VRNALLVLLVLTGVACNQTTHAATPPVTTQPPVTPEPVTPTTPPDEPPTVSPVYPPSSGDECTPGYSPCLPPASDYDCAGGSGDGPEYVQGPVQVTGSDPYGLDADGNGIGCQ
jgi:hypothetical protein